MQHGDISAQQIKRLYQALIRKLTPHLKNISFDPQSPFYFRKVAELNALVDEYLKEISQNMLTSIERSTAQAWELSVLKNQKFFEPYLNSGLLSADQILHYNNRNTEALQSFLNRKTGGLHLSDRIWNLTKQFKTELEMSLDIGLSQGKPATEIALDILNYLHQPNALLQKVGQFRGSLHLSKMVDKMKQADPVLGSSYNKAIRLARTEVNMAYRSSDLEKYRQMDFVLGYEIKRSNHPFGCPVCESLKGKYPKDFQFVGWHPNCRCYTVPILQKLEDFLEEKPITDEIKDVPDNFKQWATDNSQRMLSAQSVPYWWRDNKKYVERGLKEKTLSLAEIEKYINNGQITETIFKDGTKYIPERENLHNRIINNYFKQDKIKSEKVYMLGGAPANGKSSVTESGLLPHPKGMLVIDPDKIKAMIPEYESILKSNNKDLIKKAANFVHEESSYLGKKIREKALLENWGSIIDGVNDGSAEKIHSNAQTIRRLSGKPIRADYVSLDTDLSIKLAKLRAEKTGREVPLEFIKNMNKAISREFPTIIKNKSFDELYLWDTNINGKPRLILQQVNGKLEIIDNKLYDFFLQKANE